NLMKITCQACQSKYTIADEKIQGKVAKIRCRKCGATVLVDGSGGGAGNGAGAASSNETWMVNVAEGDQRTMSMREVVDAYRSGVVNAETFVWKDGMGDWLPIGQVPEVAAALSGGQSMDSAPPVFENSSPALQ